MILIGTMNWTSTRLRGLFRCPNCGSTQNFRLRASRPFLTLYFIPVLPIGGLEEFVQCSTCKDSFETDVLALTMLPSNYTSLSPEMVSKTIGNHPHSGSNPQGEGVRGLREIPLSEDLLKVIALIMIEDGHVTEKEISFARRLYENMLSENLSREELGRMCAFVQQQRLSTLSFLATAKNRRNHEEKLLIAQAIFGVAGADGEISPKRLQSLAKSQAILELDEAEFQRAVSQTAQWLT